MTDIRFVTEISYHLQEVLAAKEGFEAARPGVRIIVEQCNDYFDMHRTLNDDHPPDIIETGGFHASDPDRVFLDLNPYVAETEGLEADLHAGLLRVCRQFGMLPGLPVEISTPLVRYDKTMFDRAGLPYPVEGWTWDEMVETAKRLTIRDEQGIASQFGFGLGVDIEWFEPFIMRNGGRYVDDGGMSRGFVDSPATIEAFGKIIDAFRVHGIVRKPGEPVAGDDEQEWSAMTYAFVWNSRHQQSDDRYAVVGLPSMPGGAAANMIYMGGAGITAKSKNPRLAWDFLRHYLLECHSWMPPVTKSQAEARGLTKHPILSRYLQELDHVQLNGYYFSKKWNASRQLINEDILKMIAEGTDVAQTLRSWTRYA